MDLLTTEEVARLARLGSQAIRRRSKRGLPPFPAVRIGGSLRFERAHVEAWIRGEIPDRRQTPEPAEAANG